MLYVGTDMGVYASLDGGRIWTTFGSGLPDTPVHDIQIQARDRVLVAASHGRTLWSAPLAWVKKTKENLASGKRLVVDDLADFTGGVRSHPPYAWVAEYPLVESVTIWSQDAGDALVRLETKKGGFVLSNKVHLDRGVNVVSLPLALFPGSDEPIARRPVNPDDPSQALMDPFGAARPKYPAPGDYVVKVQMGTAKAEAPLKVVEG